MDRTIARSLSSGATALAVAAIVLLVAAGGASAGEQGGIGCVNSTGWAYQCGDTVAESCTFNGDLNCESPGHGLIVDIAGITIDGDGYAITGNRSDCPWCDYYTPQSAYCGIINQGYDNVVVKNLEVKNFCIGIGITYTNNNTVFNCSVHHNGDANRYTYGITAVNSDYMTIDDCSIYNNTGRLTDACVSGGHGIHFYNFCDYCNVTDSFIVNNNLSGIWASSTSSNLYIANNTVENNGICGDSLMGSTNGINLHWEGGVPSPRNSIVESNRVLNNTGSGIYAAQISITIKDNVVTGTKNGTGYAKGHGLSIISHDGHESNINIYNNTFCDNEGWDIYDDISGGSNTGDNNTCDTTYNYNDTGTTGCTYECVHHIVIRDAANGGGSEVTTHTMTTADDFQVWCAGYGADGNYINDAPCTWNTTGTLDPLLTGHSTNAIFRPSTSDTNGTITAVCGQGHADTTGIITVDEGGGCVGLVTGHVYHCGEIVTESCTLNGNMRCLSGAGLTVGADDITIDGAGYKLIGNVVNADCSDGSGSNPCVLHSGIINTGGYDEVVIKDVEIQNFCTGIVMAQPVIENMTVTGCKIHDCGSESITHGIHMVNPIYSIITKNEIYNISGTGPASGCGGGGNGIFMFGGQQGSWEHGSGDHNTITCNRIYDVEKTGIFMKMGCMHNYVSHNRITGCPESGINPMCMMSNYNTYEYNNLSDNIGGGFSTGGSYNSLSFNTAHNNGGRGIRECDTGNSATNNSACGNGYSDIDANICENNTCGSGCGCEWNCNNPVPIYFDFDNDGRYSNTTENCTCNNILNVGVCCNPGLFNSSHAGVLNASGICWLTPGDDPNDCDLSIPGTKPDLVIIEKSEEWVDFENKTYNITYTVKNIGNADANESTTSIRIDGTEVATDPVELLAPQATHTAELGPFTMSDGSDMIRVCADSESVVIESNEDSNGKENIFKFHGKPDLVISKKYEEWVASNETYNTYTITYTVENLGTGDANESATAILIDGTEVATDPVEALDEGESCTSTLGPFTMTGENDTIIICADNESMVDESDEDNNCIENTFNYSEIGCVAVDGTLFRYGNTVTKSCTLNGDLLCTIGAGLIIGADGITIDGDEHRITGTTTPADCDGMGSEASPCTVSGIYNAGFDNVIIKNLEIENFCTGIVLTGVCNITVNNCSIHDNGFNTGNMATHGIHACNIAEGAPDDPALTITENEIYNNEGTGAACGDGGNGIFIFAGSGDKHEYCNISYNRLHDNAKAGFWTKMMLTRSEIAHNEIWGNGYGTGVTDGQRGGIVLRCKMSNENLIAHNDVHDNDVDGIFIGGSSNTIEYNNVTNNTDDGIDVGRSDGSYDNEVYENTVCDNWDKDISTFGAGSNTTGDENTCDTTKDYDDTGTAGCTYPCGGVCGDVDGLPGVTTNDGRQIFMYLLHGGGEYPLADTWAADCDGLCDGITTNDGRHIFMHLLHDDPAHPENDQYPLNCSC